MTAATLIYNPRARGAASLSLSDLEAALRVAGYGPEYRRTDAVADLDAALRDPGEVVVVAGGDGTIRAAALRLLGRGVPLAPLLLGTANNICHLPGARPEWPSPRCGPGAGVRRVPPVRRGTGAGPLG